MQEGDGKMELSVALKDALQVSRDGGRGGRGAKKVRRATIASHSTGMTSLYAFSS